MSLEKVLVAYATRYGSSKTIAQDIENALKNRGLIVQTVDLKTVNFKDIDPKTYKGIVVGGSVAMFRLHPATKKFLKYLGKGLKGANVPLVIFIAAGTAIDDPKKAEEKWINKYVEKYVLRPALIQAVEPCMVMTASTKKNLQGIAKSLSKQAGKEFDPEGMNDLRDGERFQAFLDRIVGLMD